MNLKHYIIMFWATGAFSGNIPFAPGTFGTLVGLPLCFLLSRINVQAAFLFILGFTVFAVWIAEEAEKILHAKDPGCIVIDEIAGIMVTLLGVPFTPSSAVAGFFLFRFFDILKFFPLRILETRIRGGAGVVLDDIVAGIMANCVLRLVLELNQ